VGTTIVFRVGAPDGETLQFVFTPIFAARDITSLPNFRAYVRSFGNFGMTPFIIDTVAALEGEEETMTADAFASAVEVRARQARPRGWDTINFRCLMK
jgi:hypothetical protein